MPVVVYNPLGWSMSRWVQHPFPSPSARVVDAGGQSVASQVTPTAPMTTVCQSDSATCTASQYGNDLSVCGRAVDAVLRTAMLTGVLRVTGTSNSRTSSTSLPQTCQPLGLQPSWCVARLRAAQTALCPHLMRHQEILSRSVTPNTS